MLIPMRKYKDLNKFGHSKKWADNMLETTQKNLSKLLPLSENEIAFLNKLLDEGEIRADFLTQDSALCKNILLQPGLKWKAVNVKKYKKPLRT